MSEATQDKPEELPQDAKEDVVMEQVKEGVETKKVQIESKSAE